MAILADTHVHIYPCYDLRAFFHHAFSNFSALGSTCDDKNYLFLTERFDCNYFSAFARGDFVDKLPELSFESLNNQNTLIVKSEEGSALTIVAGRQIVSAEKIEILALNCSDYIRDGLPAEETISLILQLGGTPVLPWAPGKWSLSRKKVIERQILHSNPNQLLIADSSLRPLGWPMPGLIKKAARLGFRIIAGSDPLPFSGQERLVASYCVKSINNTSVQTCDFLFSAELALVGSRSSAPAMLSRLYRNEKVRRR